MMNYRFNVTFTRPDENNATVYVVGYNAYGTGVVDLPSAEQWTREAFAHVTILTLEFMGSEAL